MAQITALWDYHNTKETQENQIRRSMACVYQESSQLISDRKLRPKLPNGAERHSVDPRRAVACPQDGPNRI
jgi:hypothetical protein